MHLPADSTEEGYAYRRIMDRDWKERSGAVVILPAAFVPKPGTSLSVFLTTKVPSRRYVLQHHLDTMRRTLGNPTTPQEERQRIQARLEKTPTVEALYEVGWRIVRFPIDICYVE